VTDRPASATAGFDQARLATAREDLARQGFASLGQLLDPAAVAQLNAELDQRAAEGLEPCEYGILSNNAWEWHRGFEALIREGPLAAMASDLLGSPEVVLFQDNLVWKTPGTPTRLEWHQDYSYWPLSGPEGLTMWLALDDADPDNGCLHFLPGTHLLGERQPADFVRGAGQPPLPGLEPLDWERREHEAVGAPARAGELLVHHPFVWHMSPANHSTRHRRAWTLTWIRADVRWDPEHAPHPFNYQLLPERGAPVEGPRFPRFGGPNVSRGRES
jgi:ectoine hydroxylase-related dioxygenase (phytanoyl-CoA dioxygenase family)